MKKVLITGANSYIGMSFENWMAEKHPREFEIDTVDMIGDTWREKDFSGYDVVFHVAGIAHRKENKKNAQLYYQVNRDLTIATAKKAKMQGIKQFIVLSSMSVYGREIGVIKKDDIPKPKNHYGKSKWQADTVIKKLEDEKFKVAILRPPMVYGNGCKGNYRLLCKFAQKSPVCPDYRNYRSMISINNLCDFVYGLIEKKENGLFFPQDEKYICTSDLVKNIARENGKNIIMIRFTNPLITLGIRLNIKFVKKVFGNLIYERESR